MNLQKEPSKFVLIFLLVNLTTFSNLALQFPSKLDETSSNYNFFNLIFNVVFPSQVSWIRKRDLHIMTIGILTYTNDQRYQAIHTEGSDEWSLRVMSAQPRDNGIYECQVSTEPKISQAYRLNVIGELCAR